MSMQHIGAVSRGLVLDVATKAITRAHAAYNTDVIAYGEDHPRTQRAWARFVSMVGIWKDAGGMEAINE